MKQKTHTWTLIKRLAGLSSYPWLCFGYFNEILHTLEKTGRTNRNLSMVAEFRQTIHECNLVDTDCRDCPFTLSNRRFGPYFIEEILDIFFCSKDLRKEFSQLNSNQPDNMDLRSFSNCYGSKREKVIAKICHKNFLAGAL